MYLVDFSNFVYRFKSVYKFAKIEVDNVVYDTSILVGFIKCLKSNLDNDIVIVLDGIPKKSLSILPGYKGQRTRDEAPQYIPVSKTETIKFLTQIGSLLNKNVSVVCSPNQETDEVIGSIVYDATKNLPSRAQFISTLNSNPLESDKILSRYKEGVVAEQFRVNDVSNVVIGSTDGDFIQLLRFPNVYIDLSLSCKQISNVVTSVSTNGTTPIASVAYKAIYGDSSDNIPSLNISLKKKDVIDLLNKFDENCLNQFYDCCVNGYTENFTGILNDLIKEVYSQVNQFKVNWEVAFLTFRSFPIKLSYPDYDIQQTMKRYHLHV